uniref:Tyrosine specific protein phosphatases domain-containing protein n=1 Tax=Timema genevievae TaxID=629358 RepID=A0A7R9K3K7_TIMGE|nr:unnamed protein product [Timema genevievae]
MEEIRIRSLLALDRCQEILTAKKLNLVMTMMAGLGRTGSLIGAYLVKHYHMAAREAIAWLRICRPGCVIGRQQTWLEDMEGMLWKLGEDYRTGTWGLVKQLLTYTFL